MKGLVNRVAGIWADRPSQLWEFAEVSAGEGEVASIPEEAAEPGAGYLYGVDFHRRPTGLHDARILASLTGMHLLVALEIIDSGGLHHNRARIVTLPPEVRSKAEMLLEYSVRVAQRRLPERLTLKTTDALAEYLILKYYSPDQEVAGALYLDCRGGHICDKVFYRGTVTRGVMEPRMLFKVGLLVGATALVIFHSHPTGTAAPSAEDLVMTRRLAEVGKVIGILVKDHLVLGNLGRWVSMLAKGAW